MRSDIWDFLCRLHREHGFLLLKLVHLSGFCLTDGCVICVQDVCIPRRKGILVQTIGYEDISLHIQISFLITLRYDFNCISEKWNWLIQICSNQTNIFFNSSSNTIITKRLIIFTMSLNNNYRYSDWHSVMRAEIGVFQMRL